MQTNFRSTISVSFWFLFIIALAVYIGKGSVLPLLTAILIHELAHIAMIMLCGYKINRIQCSINGIQIDIRNEKNKRLLWELLISASGPIAGIIAAQIFYSLGYREYCFINLVLSLFNLLPIVGLDGGKIVYEICTSVSPVYGQMLCYIISWISILLLLGSGILLYSYHQHMSQLLLLAAIMLLFGRVAAMRPRNRKI